MTPYYLVKEFTVHIFMVEKCFLRVGVAQSVQRLRYGLDGPGIESRCGARFFAPVQTGCRSHPASCTTGTGSFPGVKRPGCGFDHPHI
jgi:hypothetical protein